MARRHSIDQLDAELSCSVEEIIRSCPRSVHSIVGKINGQTPHLDSAFLSWERSVVHYCEHWTSELLQLVWRRQILSHKRSFRRRWCGNDHQISHSAIPLISFKHVSHSKAGKSDIHQEITSEKNPRFVLHDSQGFAAGETSNFETVENFIRTKTLEKDVRNRLHAIW